MAKSKPKKTFWQRFKWWLYALQWFFTAIGIYQVALWMSVPENRKNALIGAVIAAGFLLFGAIAVWRARSSKRNATKETARHAREARERRLEATASEDARKAGAKTAAPEVAASGRAPRTGYNVSSTADSLGGDPVGPTEDSDEERMRAIEEELSRHG